VATETPIPGTIFLPITVRNACRPQVVHTDVVLVIDASSSMLEQSGESTKLEAAKAAALHFVDQLDLQGDQAAVVSFSSEAKLGIELNSDREALRSAIEAIQTGIGTRIDLALAASRVEMQSDRVIAENNQVVILLTDGRPTEGTAGAALSEASQLKSAGAVIYAIGLGADVDSDLLRLIASSDSTYIEAPTADDLERIYEEVAGELPCPGGAIWGGN
jgi:Mg-chelatase subunit ChlD